MLLIRRLSNEARLFQSFQAVGKNVGRNAFGRILQLSIGHITPEQVPNHKQRPLVANQVERACDRTDRQDLACSIDRKRQPASIYYRRYAVLPEIGPRAE